jgi:serine/threonine protein kinase
MVQICDFGITAHRDIKPANCLLDGKKWLKIADLGLAKSFDTAELPLRRSSDAHFMSDREAEGRDTPQHTATWENLSVIATRNGAVAGTPAYMAPECFYGLEYSDTRSDVYSFGVMLFQMITGRLPFVADSWIDFMHLHEDATPPTIPTAFEGLADLVTRCLAKTPNERFADFRELYDALALSFYDPYETYVDFLVRLPNQGREQSDADLLAQAHSLKELGKYNEALNILGHLVERNTKNGQAFTAMGALLAHKLHRFQEALHMFQKARECGVDVEEQIAMCRRQMN